MARTELQSDKAKGKVVKLSYQVSSSFRILRYTDQGSYILQRYDKPLSSEVKYMTKDLYLLPSKLLTYNPVDGTDSCYLISLYNDNFYSSTPSTAPLKFDYSNKALVCCVHSGVSNYLSM